MPAIPREALRWLPGPILTIEHRVDAIRQVAQDLRHLAANSPAIPGAGPRSRRHHAPETWIAVAADLGIVATPYYAPGGSSGRLSYDKKADVWVLWYNIAHARIQQATALVHELAHWYFREAGAPWLCGEEIVYYYEGPVEDERHRLARDVEQIVVPTWRSAPTDGLFEVM